MKHYTEFLPKDLALKLQDAGMKIDWEDNSPDEHPNTDVNCLTTYADCFDWFMERGMNIYVVKAKECSLWHSYINEMNLTTFHDSWFESADIAIERAIRLLEETQKH